MKLSIITINYNNLAGLKRTVDSILCQTYRDFEWIIIDGGSTDGSKELIEKIASNPSSNIAFWCSEPDKGIYNAMNKGIVRASGEYLNFMNSGDSFCDSSTLMTVSAFMDEDSSIDIYYGDHVLFCGEKQTYMKSPKLISLSMFVEYGINHQSTFIKRTLFENGAYDESLRVIADWKLFLQCMLQGKRFQYIELPICKFEDGGISQQSKDLVAAEKEKVKRELLSPNVKVDLEELASYRKFSEVNEIRDIVSHRRLFKRLCDLFIYSIKLLQRFGL